ncbi:MAG: serine/threonine-protein phosphatase [Chloroflexia bacterium]|nr:serine/threonine-protein phosphatase [Chloroflexia bacterium]
MDDGGPDLRIVVGAATDVGGRGENEDTVLVTRLAAVGDGVSSLADGYLVAVADGMGGYHRGEVASRLAVNTIQEMFADDPGADSALLLKQAFRRANEAIFADGRGAGSSSMMGTTLVAMAIRGQYATVASIGDSRVYLIRANQLTQITQDHSLVAEQVNLGSLTAEEARESAHRNILTQALGHRALLDKKMPDIFELTLLPEDRLLLCSDGFYDVVPDQEMASIVIGHEAETAAKRLVDLAVARGTTDNVSAVVVEALPSRTTVKRELVMAGAERRPPSYLFPALALLGIIVFVAIVLFVLTFM